MLRRALRIGRRGDFNGVKIVVALLVVVSRISMQAQACSPNAEYRVKSWVSVCNAPDHVSGVFNVQTNVYSQSRNTMLLEAGNKVAMVTEIAETITSEGVE
jgi:hypothetical protein